LHLANATEAKGHKIQQYKSEQGFLVATGQISTRGKKVNKIFVDLTSLNPPIVQ
jgi:hypothetical protein